MTCVSLRAIHTAPRASRLGNEFSHLQLQHSIATPLAGDDLKSLSLFVTTRKYPIFHQNGAVKYYTGTASRSANYTGDRGDSGSLRTTNASYRNLKRADKV